MAELQKIVPFLWFDRDAERAVAFYLSVFGGRETGRFLFPDIEGSPGTPGELCTIEFEVLGQRLSAINGQQPMPYSHALSLMVVCEDQQELDRYWDRIVEGGGKPVACGWISDPWGVSWQIVPKSMMDLLMSGDTAASARAYVAMMSMEKLDGPALAAAARGEAI